MTRPSLAHLLVLVGGALALSSMSAGRGEEAQVAECCKAAVAGQGESGSAQPTYKRSVESYHLPDVKLRDMQGREIELAAAVDDARPVMLQFIFTTCSTICPVLSNTFASAQGELESDLDQLQMLSISIDPEHDTPKQLRQYAERLNAGPQWEFMTGRLSDVGAVQRAFDAYQVNKMNHEPLTFIRAAAGDSWVRLTGLMKSTEFVAEYRAALDDAERRIELGRRIYEEGIDVSGNPLQATVHGDLAFDGTLFTCASCHRSSGFGAAEGGTLAPPVTGEALYRPRDWRGQDLMRNVYRDRQPDQFKDRLRQMTRRPAYDDETLARAIRTGFDPDGREIDATMPRYDLDDEDVHALISYLKTLHAEPAPGVGKTEIHFATVVMEGVPAERRENMLGVLNAYARRKNIYIHHELAHPGHSPGFKDYYYSAYRKWVLHVWDLSGPRDTWAAQLDRYYEQQPVFALVSGIGEGSWKPVHEFCERNQVPCMFPNTPLPELEVGDYTFYFSRGLTLEAEALATYIRRADVTSARRVVQVYRADENGAVPARALRAGLAGHADIEVVDRLLDTPLDGSAAGWRTLIGDAPTTVVLWLDDVKPEALASLDVLPTVDRVFLSSTMRDHAPATAPSGCRKLHLLFPFGLPGELEPAVFQDRSWLHSRGLRLTDERLQLNTYFAVTMMDAALMHIIDTFSREYFLEGVEHGTDEQLTFGAYPHLGLGPGQRIGSKGCHILQLSDDPEAAPRILAEWVIP